VVFLEDHLVALFPHHTRFDKTRPEPFAGSALDRRDVGPPADRALEHDEAIVGEQAAPGGPGGGALKHLVCTTGAAGQRIEDGEAERRQQNPAGLEDFKAVGFEGSGRMRLGAGIAVFHPVEVDPDFRAR